MAAVETKVVELEWVTGNCGVEDLYGGSGWGVEKLVGWIRRVGEGNKVAKEAFGGVV
jgi:hypothetical protein